MYQGLLRLLPAAIVVCAAGCVRTPDMETAQQFQAAQAAFDAAETQEDFLRAAGLYQAILDGGCRSGAVLYNQGNAFMRAGQRGRAIACYRQAQRYRPRDPFLDHNLRHALGSSSSSSQRSMFDYIFFWQSWISYAGKFRLLAAVSAVTFALGIAALLVRRRRWLVHSSWIGLVVSLLLAASAVYDWYRFDVVRRGVIITDEVVARKGDGDSYAPAFTQPLSEGTEFRALEHRGQWQLIRLAGDKEGWVRRDDIVVF
jgi:hypothetical protein